MLSTSLAWMPCRWQLRTTQSAIRAHKGFHFRSSCQGGQSLEQGRAKINGTISVSHLPVDATGIGRRATLRRGFRAHTFNKRSRAGHKQLMQINRIKNECLQAVLLAFSCAPFSVERRYRFADPLPLFQCCLRVRPRGGVGLSHSVNQWFEEAKV